MYLRLIYNRVSTRTPPDRIRRAAWVSALLLVLSGCESPPRPEPASAVPAVAPSSDVRRVRAFQDAERIAAADKGRSSAVGQGESMAPIFGDTTMLVLTRVPYEQLEAGMIVAYRNRRGVQVVHRLLERTRQDGWRVQGINNPHEDAEPVTRSNYIGVVYASLVHGDDAPPSSGPAPTPAPGPSREVQP